MHTFDNQPPNHGLPPALSWPPPWLIDDCCHQPPPTHATSMSYFRSCGCSCACSCHCSSGHSIVASIALDVLLRLLLCQTQFRLLLPSLFLHRFSTIFYIRNLHLTSYHYLRDLVRTPSCRTPDTRRNCGSLTCIWYRLEGTCPVTTRHIYDFWSPK